MCRSLVLPLLSAAALCFSPAMAHDHDDHDHAHYLDTFERQQLSDVYYSEGAAGGDINGDGVGDVVCGPFWYAGPKFTTRHEIYPAVPQNRDGYADNFLSWVHDFDGDGAHDVLMVGFPGKQAFVYRNPGHRQLDGLWERFTAADSVANESPQFTDLTGDGIPELVCTRNGHYGYYQRAVEFPLSDWTFVEVSDDVAPKPFGHGLGVGDINNDGRNDIIARDGWFEHPANPDTERHWTFHRVPFAPGGADMFAYDVDGDGDNDVITSLNAHAYGLAWHESLPGNDGIPAFQQHLIMGEKKSDSPWGVLFTEPHAVQLADINGDGLQDIVTGKTYWSHHTQSPLWDAGAVVYWFELRRHRDPGGKMSVDWVPHEADGEAGIGRGLFVGDLNGDGLPEIVSGGMKGAHVLRHSRTEVSPLEFDLAQPRRRPSMAAGLPPEAAASQMTVPSGFRVQLAAGEPMIHQPIAMCFDAKGRLWVAEAHTYPRRAEDGQGKDHIMIYEDTDLDGVFDTSKTFISGLNLVSGLEVGFGGVYVGAAPYLMFIPDRDGDDRPDPPGADGALLPEIRDHSQRTVGATTVDDQARHLQFPDDVPDGAIVLRDGFGWQDTHETLNAFIWGPDGWLYGCHGVFTHSQVGRPGTDREDRTGLNAGVWRYHPVKDEFEVFAHGTSNPWGVDFNDHGQCFITACVIPHLWHMIQGGRYHRQGGRHFNPHTYDDIKTIADHLHYVGNIRDHAWWGHEPQLKGDTSDAGGGHAHAGAMIYRGDNWPDEYRNRIFFNNIHGNRVNQELLVRQPNDSGYVGRHADDFLLANDRYYRGINLRYGPDGSVYLIDWYDKNACHRTNPEIWDRSNGRIFRVSYGDCQPQQIDLEQLSNEELVRLLTHRNNWYVTMARRILQQRGGDSEVWTAIQQHVLDEVTALDSVRDVSLILNALWTLHATGGLEHVTSQSDWFDSIPSEYVIAWKIQLALEDRQVSPAVLQQLLRLAQSTSSPVVRLYLASGLQRLPLEQRWELAEALSSRSEDTDDHNIPLLLWYGIEPLVPDNPPRAMQLAAASEIPLLQRYIVRRAAADSSGIDAVVAALTEAAGSQVLMLVMEEMLSAFEGRVAIAMPDSWSRVYDTLRNHDDLQVRDRADQLAVIFGDRRVYPVLRQLLADSDSDPNRRRQALNVLVRGGDKGAVDVLLSDNVLSHADLQGPAVRALSTLGNERVPEALLQRYAQFGADARRDVVSTLVSRPDWTSALLTSVGSGVVPAPDLTAYHVRQIVAFKNDSLNSLLKKHWGEIRETSADRRQLMADWKKRLTPDVLKSAHLGNGRRVFNQTCANCHRLFGSGGTIGPDITGSNRANLDYILENVLDPSAVVGRNYRMTTIVLNSGRIVSGMLVQETDSALTVQTINDRIVVPKDDIDELIPSTISMMPERQLDALPPNDARDLIAYLASPQQVAVSGPPASIDDATGKVPGAIEGESMTVVEKTGGQARNQGMGGFKRDRWSGNDHLWWTGAQPGDRLSLELPVPEDGKWNVELVLTRARDYGIVRVLIDDQVLDPALDLFHKDVVTTGVMTYPGVSLKAGPHRLTLEITGANEQALKRYMVGVDFVRLQPIAQQ